MDDFIENLETLTLDNNNLPQTDDVSICYLIVQNNALQKTQVANPEFVKSNVRGTIKFYTEDKKYGYITREDGNGDIYVSEVCHSSAL